MFDSTHAGLPGATVTAVNIGTGAQRTVVTDAEGRFSIPALPAATYRVRVDLTGFQPTEIASLVLRSGETVRSDLTLTISGIAESVSVQSEPPLLQSASASVSATITEKMLEELPLSGRTLLNITALAPGVTPRDFQRQNLFYGRRDQYVTVEGGRDSSTNYAIDGVYVRTLRWNNMSLNPPVDSVQEVNLLRNAFSTEYGQGQAVVSMVTKSGTNRASFSAYEYFRGDALEAKNYFAVSKTPHDRNQFGGTYGGPIVPNKLFVFAAYEGLRQTKGEVQFANLPNPVWLTGDLSSVTTPIVDPLTGQPFTGNRIPQNRITPFAAQQLSAVPSPNTTGVNNYRVVRNFTDDTDTVTARTDYTVNADHTLFGRYIWGTTASSPCRRPSPIPASLRPARTWRSATPGSSPVAPSTKRGSATTIRSTANTPRCLARTISRATGSPISGCAICAAGANPAYYGRPGATITGSGESCRPAARARMRPTGSTASRTRPARSLARTRCDSGSRPSGARRIRTRPPAPAAASRSTVGDGRGEQPGQRRRRLSARLLFDVHRHLRWSTVDLQVPDVCPFHRRRLAVNNQLTLQLGVRWEYLAPWHEVNDIEGSFDPVTGKIATTRCRPTCRPRFCRWSLRKTITFRRESSRRTSTTSALVWDGLPAERAHAAAIGIRAVLRQPESQRAAVHSPGAAVQWTL